jgi:hypothetical protein
MLSNAGSTQVRHATTAPQLASDGCYVAIMVAPAVQAGVVIGFMLGDELVGPAWFSWQIVFDEVTAFPPLAIPFSSFTLGLEQHLLGAGALLLYPSPHFFAQSFAIPQFLSSS